MRSPLVAACLLAATLPARAQTPAPAAPASEVALASLQGVVYDSLLTHRPLPGAEVWLEGTLLSAKSDGRGRFYFPQVPATRYRIVAYHPSLDSLGFSAPVRTIDLAGLPAAFLTLATPDGRTIYKRQCPGHARQASGMLLGTVRDARTSEPLAGAVVEVQWREWTIGSGPGDQGPRDEVASAVSDSAGRYRVCGVPTDAPVALITRRGGAVAGPVEVDLRGGLITAQHITIGTAPAEPGAAAEVAAEPAVEPLRRAGGRTVALQERRAPAAGAEAATISGRIRNSQGDTPVAEAEVRLFGRTTGAVSGADGGFTLGALPAGTHSLEVRALGFLPKRLTVHLVPGRTLQMAVQLEPTAYVLDPVKVTGESGNAGIAGFERRRAGGGGTFITEEQIRKRNPASTNDLFLGVAGMELRSVAGNTAVLMKRAATMTGKFGSAVCFPQYYVDGQPRQLGVTNLRTGELVALERGGAPVLDLGPNILVSPGEIHGIEIYRGLGAIPPEFARFDSGCGVIAIWTKRGKPNAYYRNQDDSVPEQAPLPDRHPESDR